MGLKTRIIIAGVFGIGSVLCVDSVVNTQVADACGVKVAVKAAPLRRNMRRAQRKRHPLKRSSKSAIRRRIAAKGSRRPVASGSQRQARRAPIGRSHREHSTEPRRREHKTEPKVAANKPHVKKTTDDKKADDTKVAINETEATNETPVKATEPEPTKTEPEHATTEPKPAVDNKPGPSAEVYFDKGSSTVSEDSKAALQDMVDWLKAHPKRRILVSGFADPSGSARLNMRLSLKRARAVSAFLMEASGASKRRIRVRALGESHLKYAADSAQNRRVFVKPRK